MYAMMLFAVSIAICALLLQVNAFLAAAFFIAALIFIPTLMLHRRETANALECGPESEPPSRGIVRLAGSLSLDLTGVALGTLIVILCVLVLHVAGKSH
jgi:hypothetical protein